MEPDPYALAVDAFALEGEEPWRKPVEGRPAAAVACTIAAARALSAIRVHQEDLDAAGLALVERRLAARQEWHALAVWQALRRAAVALGQRAGERR